MHSLFDMEEERTPLQDNEFYTPSKYIEAARRVLGTIDLDPASCAQANQIVKASRYYTQEEDGLLQPWYGCVWLNPPYGTTGLCNHKGVSTGKSYIRLFSEKLLEEYQTGKVTQAIFLCRADPSARWFFPLFCYPICFVSGSFAFHRPNGEKREHKYGTCFIYFGSAEARFIEEFGKFGRIVKAIDTPPRSSIHSPSLW